LDLKGCVWLEAVLTCGLKIQMHVQLLGRPWLARLQKRGQRGDQGYDLRYLLMIHVPCLVEQKPKPLSEQNTT
jgi:hypothetical protein